MAVPCRSGSGVTKRAASKHPGGARVFVFRQREPQKGAFVREKPKFCAEPRQRASADGAASSQKSAFREPEADRRREGRACGRGLKCPANRQPSRIREKARPVNGGATCRRKRRAAGPMRRKFTLFRSLKYFVICLCSKMPFVHSFFPFFKLWNYFAFFILYIFIPKDLPFYISHYSAI